MRTMIGFISAQVSSCHQTLYRACCLNLSQNGKAYPSPPQITFLQTSIACENLFINFLFKRDSVNLL